MDTRDSRRLFCQAFGLVATRLAQLGSKLEWSMSDDLDATQELARLAEMIT